MTHSLQVTGRTNNSIKKTKFRRDLKKIAKTQRNSYESGENTKNIAKTAITQGASLVFSLEHRWTSLEHRLNLQSHCLILDRASGFETPIFIQNSSILAIFHQKYEKLTKSNCPSCNRNNLTLAPRPKPHPGESSLACCCESGGVFGAACALRAGEGKGGKGGEGRVSDRRPS